MIPISCLFAAYVMLNPMVETELANGGIIRVRSDSGCEVTRQIVPHGIKLKHRFVTATIPIPADGLWHMVVYDFRDDKAQVSVMTIQDVQRFVGEY